MDIPELKAFIAVTQARSFSKAASYLHMSQPAISRRIQSLEASLKQQLFDRDGHTIHLTTAGHLLVPKAQSILELVSQTEIQVKSMGEDIQGPLHLAISHHFAEHYLAGPLSAFAVQYPKVNLSFQFLESEAACKQVIQGEVDVGLVTLPPADEYNKLQACPLHIESLHFMVSKAHPLASQKSPISVADLCQHQALLPPLSSYTGRQIIQSFKSSGALFPTVIECNAFSSLKTLLLSGLGWGLLPDPLICHDIHKIHVAPLVEIKRSIGLVSHNNRLSSPAATAFKQLLNL